MGDMKVDVIGTVRGRDDKPIGPTVARRVLRVLGENGWLVILRDTVMDFETELDMANARIVELESGES